MKRMYMSRKDSRQDIFVLETDEYALKKINGTKVAYVSGNECHTTAATWVHAHDLVEIGVTRLEKERRKSEELSKQGQFQLFQSE